MKRIATILVITATLAACSNSSQPSAETKQQALKEVRDSLKLDSFHRAEAEQLKTSKEEVRALASTPRRSTGNRTYVKGVSESYSNTQPQKKGWSKAAKGAAIGAGAGAVTGVIVDKKDGRGAVVGGLVGAGTGYVIGRSQDKKDGRVQ